jgi:hypothetical protein
MKSTTGQVQSNRDLIALEAAAALPMEGHDEEWLRIAREVVKIPIAAIPGLQEALRQGRWRSAKNPVGYVRMVAKREAVRMGLGPESKKTVGLKVPSVEGSELSHDDYVDFQSSGGIAPTANGVWRQGSEADDDFDDFNENGERMTRREKLVSRLPAGFTSTIELPSQISTEPTTLVLWDDIASASNLTDRERQVLSFKRDDVSLERARAMQGTQAERNALTAAWRQWDRVTVPKMYKSMISKHK